jgi:hypothetical protein
MGIIQSTFYRQKGPSVFLVKKVILASQKTQKSDLIQLNRLSRYKQNYTN